MGPNYIGIRARFIVNKECFSGLAAWLTWRIHARMTALAQLVSIAL